MNASKQTLLDLLTLSHQLTPNSKQNKYKHLNTQQMAHLYINAALLGTAVGYLQEQLWLQKKEDESTGENTSYNDFLTPFFDEMLLSIDFLKVFLIESGPTQLKKLGKTSHHIEANVLAMINDGPYTDQKDFAIQSLTEMRLHFQREEQRQEGRAQHLGHEGPCLYRTFDNLDDIFEFDYQLDRDMIVDHSIKERLYWGSGAAVQSGYSTILLALQHIELPAGSKVVDLGSGYGRVGLVFSLLYPDIEFTGYEYVPHRVDASNHISTSLDLHNNLSFHVQDLSLPSFRIPDADVYYLYDPFTDETYEKILLQIVEVSHKRDITVVTKGNARKWLIDVASEQSWPELTRIDEGNLCIFRSTPQ